MKTVSSLTLLLIYFYCRGTECNEEDESSLERPHNRLCSKPGEFLHKESGVCYPGEANCFGLMQFYETEGGYGECDCGERFLYWWPYNRCYYPYTKGPCPYGEWITLNPETETAMCKKNPCGLEKSNENLALYSSSKKGGFDHVWFEQFGKCWKYETQGYCPIGYLLRNFKELEEQETGKCLAEDDSINEIQGTANLHGIPCKPGHKYSNTRLCRRLVSFRG